MVLRNKIKKHNFSFFLNYLLFIIFIIFIVLHIPIVNAQCPSNTWMCNNRVECINSTFRCDGVVHCSDGSDEGVSCNLTCALNEFKCLSDNECIRRDFLCDYDNDCADGSDENQNCTFPNCSLTQFQCANKRCITQRFLCDGDDDCLDKSDEKFCALRSCPPNQLPCNRTAKCINIEKFCDGIPDCSDGSDEGSTCSNTRCASLSCLHQCRSTPTGGACYCPNGRMLDPVNNRTCIDINECEMWNECDQTCINIMGSYSCQCEANYTLQANGHCKHVDSDSVKIIFSIGTKLFESDKNGQNIRQIYENNDLDIISVDYNFATKILYFADGKKNKIYKSQYEVGSTLQQTNVIVDANLIGPISIAYDWINDKLYVVEKSTSRIDVFTTLSNSAQQMRSNLITTNIYSPTSIALDPLNSYLFFTDTGGSTKLQKPKIERAFMDGTNRLILVTEKLLEPVAITLDLIKKQIYWVDKKYDHIETCDYMGLKRHVIASGSQNLPHTIGLNVFENTVYYADITKLAIMKFPRHTYYTEANITYHYKFTGGSGVNSVQPKAINIYHKTKQPLRQNPCITLNGSLACEHICLLSHTENQFANAYRCKCRLGYQLRRDLKTCEQVIDYIYFTQANMIRAISLDQTSTTESRIPVAIKQSAVDAIEADCRLNRTYFYDGVKSAIFQTSFNGDEPQVIIPNNLMSVEGLAYDWITRNLYFTDYNKVTVVQLDNVNTRRDIIQTQGRLFQIVIDPNVGFIFFSDLRRPAKIYRAYADGTNLTVIRGRELSLPQAVALDYQMKRLYWADAHLSKIQYSDYSGNNVFTLNLQTLGNPISLFVFNEYLYYTDARTSSLYKIFKYFGSTPTIIRANLNNLDKIRVFSKNLQISIDNHPCARQNGDCSHFCFPVPSLDPQYRLSRHCGCPYGYKLDSNMATCITNSEEPLVRNCEFSFLYKCANGRCIRRSDVCDGENDCLDFSDENNCPRITCSSDQFQCRNGTCIPNGKRCDGRIDCIDYSDELQCPQASCSSSQFRCTNGTCIPKSWMCDTDNDCGDASDEQNCTVGRCDSFSQFECIGQNGKCIDKSYVCDGDNDCGNNYDEESCPSLVCSTGQFKCPLDNLCINSTRRCDGIYDCPSFTDEENCRSTVTRRSCRSNEFQCSPSSSSMTGARLVCIPQSWRCDGHVDCENGSDEPATCRQNECSIGYFKCNNSRCIPQSWVCDNEDDCGDNSDELTNCPAVPFQCPTGMLRCTGTLEVCINRTRLCNGQPDCPDGSDEGPYCSRDDCALRNGGCSHACARSPLGSICVCPNGYRTTNATNYKKCEDINECENENVCSQKCANYNGGYTCTCDQGYSRTASSYCKAGTRDNAKMFISNYNSIMITNIEGTSTKSLRKSNTMKYITGLDYHNKSGKIFWADYQLKTIFSAYENGSDVKPLITSGIDVVESIAIDWIGGNMYWTDYILEHIEVAKLDGTRRKILINVIV